MKNENKANERVGYCGVNRLGSKFMVVQYKDANNVWIEFYDHPKQRITIVKTTWKCIQKKEVMDIYYPSVHGVGYMGKTTSRNEDGKVKESYDKWAGMLERCYSSKRRLKQPTYKGCSVCEEWKCFETFEKDYEILLKENNFPKDKRLQLDKDILKKGNKVYSKENCVLVPSRLNLMFIKSDKIRGSLPIGVSYIKNSKTNPYRAHISTGIIRPNHKKTYQLSKCFPTVEQAFYWYKEQKEQLIKSVADEYVALEYITKESRVYKALMSYEVEADD